MHFRKARSCRSLVWAWARAPPIGLLLLRPLGISGGLFCFRVIGLIWSSRGRVKQAGADVIPRFCRWANWGWERLQDSPVKEPGWIRSQGTWERAQPGPRLEQVGSQRFLRLLSSFNQLRGLHKMGLRALPGSQFQDFVTCWTSPGISQWVINSVQGPGAAKFFPFLYPSQRWTEDSLGIGVNLFLLQTTDGKNELSSRITGNFFSLFSF